MSKRARRSLSGGQKLAILREHLVDGKAVSEVCERHEVQPSLFYYWQRQLFENGASAFGPAARAASNRERQQAERIERLEAKLARKDTVIAELSEDLVELKKELGEL
jgi:transposase-like protein